MILGMETTTLLRVLSLAAVVIAFASAGLSVRQRGKVRAAAGVLFCFPFVIFATIIVWDFFAAPYLPGKPPFIGFHTLVLCTFAATQLVALALVAFRHRIASLAVSLTCICAVFVGL